VDSLAPARSALRAFGFAEFLSLLPEQLKSPPGKEKCLPPIWNVVRRNWPGIIVQMEIVRWLFPLLGERVRVIEGVKEILTCWDSNESVRLQARAVFGGNRFSEWSEPVSHMCI